MTVSLNARMEKRGREGAENATALFCLPFQGTNLNWLLCFCSPLASFFLGLRRLKMWAKWRGNSDFFFVLLAAASFFCAEKEDVKFSAPKQNFSSPPKTKERSKRGGESEEEKEEERKSLFPTKAPNYLGKIEPGLSLSSWARRSRFFFFFFCLQHIFKTAKQILPFLNKICRVSLD